MLIGTCEEYRQLFTRFKRANERLRLNLKHWPKLAAGEGIEPPKTDSKSVVFPLNEPATLAAPQGVEPQFADSESAVLTN